MIRRRLHEEGGLAMVLALMVAFVVLLLSTVVVAQSIHNGDQSAYDRRRLQSVGAAEAGLNYVFNYLEQTAASTLAGRCGTLTAGTCAGNPFGVPQPISVAISPGTATFTVTPTFYSDTNGVTPFSGVITDDNYPRSVKLVSGGTTNGQTTRTMESFMVLTAVYGGFKGAVVTDKSLSLVNSFTISGNNANDGDIYVTCTTSPCNVSATSGNQTIKGNLYAPAGSISLSAQVHVYGDVWANGAVSLSQPQAAVDGNAISSTSSISVASGVVSGKGTYCTTLSPTPMPTTRIAGGTVQSCQGAPPSPSFPHVTYDDTVSPNAAAAWRTGCSKSPVVDCYLLQTFGTVGDTTPSGCVAARNYIEGTGSLTFNGGGGVPSGYTGVVVRILSKCSYSPSPNVTVSLGADLAIITNGSITFGNQSNWNGTGTTQRKMFLITPWPQTTCSATTSSSDYHDITVGNNSNFNSLVAVGLYTPCTAHMSNSNAFYGQVIAGTADIGNNWKMNFRPIVIPGALVTGFAEDVAYIREI